VAFFTVELLVRFWASPNKIGFWKNWLNVVDVISIMPNLVELLVALVSDGTGSKAGVPRRK
jgi:hypothetical protein